nr:uncharacterized protein CTRU02_12245 [Colletotrichum truncatum]KAF6784784.1 hypothetical protein CTRU02_12245 [Colletotrichum truncatum]
MVHFRFRTSTEKNHRPQDTPYKQQRLKAWKCVVTTWPSNVRGLTLGLCPPLLMLKVLTANQVRQIRIDYTTCHELDSFDALEAMPAENVHRRFKASSAGQPVDQWKRSNRMLTFDGIENNYTLCTIEFFLPEDLQPPVYFHYHLTNFLQNHREYINSRHSEQLAGRNVSLNAIQSSDCGPLKTLRLTDDETDRIIYPCGMIANSYFNDTFEYPLRISAGSDTNRTHAYNMSRAGIANPQDKALYQPSTYRVPSIQSGNKSIIVPPPGWASRFPNGYHSGNMFDPAEDESFMVWMRTSAGSQFSKLVMQNHKDAMERGMYRLEVFTHFPAQAHAGTKSLIISTSSSIGHGNAFVGSAFVGLGSCSLLLALLSALTLRYRPRRLADHDYIYNSDMRLHYQRSNL